MRFLLWRVQCVTTTAVPSAWLYSVWSGFSSAAATRGSALAAGICSLASSSDSTAIRAWLPSGSTS